MTGAFVARIRRIMPGGRQTGASGTGRRACGRSPRRPVRRMRSTFGFGRSQLRSGRIARVSIAPRQRRRRSPFERIRVGPWSRRYIPGQDRMNVRPSVPGQPRPFPAARLVPRRRDRPSRSPSSTASTKSRLRKSNQHRGSKAPRRHARNSGEDEPSSSRRSRRIRQRQGLLATMPRSVDGLDRHEGRGDHDRGTSHIRSWPTPALDGEPAIPAPARSRNSSRPNPT